MRERKIVLLIDAENTSARYAKRIVDYLEKRGDIICARIYGDFINNVSVKGWNQVAIEYEMEQKQQLTTSAGKNSSDIALVIDAMDLLYQKNIDTLCIVTSDGDFTGLVKRIREDGIEVIGIGKTDASKRLEKVCDQFLDFDELTESGESRSNRKKGTETNKKAGETQKAAGLNKKATEANKKAKNTVKQFEKKAGKEVRNQERKPVEEQKALNSQKANGGNVIRVGTKKAVWGKEEKEHPISKDRQKLGEVKTIIHEIVQQEEKNGKHAELGGIKSQLQLKYPGFDEKEFGYKTIRELINEETKFQVVLEGRHTYVVPEHAANVKKVKQENTAEQNMEIKDTKKKKMGFSFRGFMPKKNK